MLFLAPDGGVTDTWRLSGSGTFTEIGVMALSGRDGRVVWRAPIDRVPRAGLPVKSIVDTVVSDRAVLVTTRDTPAGDRFAVTASTIRRLCSPRPAPRRTGSRGSG